MAALAAEGDERAFEELYDRHHAALLGFCRHLLGSHHEAEDALQQTFLRAHRALGEHGAPEEPRPWLYAIARNRCRTILATRRTAALPEEGIEPVAEGLGAEVQQRADLRQLVADVQRLPEDQRAALLLAELADLPHAEIAGVIGVPVPKVKALVHQARSRLLAERDARETPCEEVRVQLANARGGELRRGPLRRHLNGCPPCRSYKASVSDQRAALALVLPVIPSAGLKAAVLDAALGGGSAAGAGALAGGGAAGTAGGAAAGTAGSGAATAGAAGTAGTAAATGGGLAGGGSLALAGGGLATKLAVGALLVGGAGGGAALAERGGREAPAPVVPAAVVGGAGTAVTTRGATAEPAGKPSGGTQGAGAVKGERSRGRQEAAGRSSDAAGRRTGGSSSASAASRSKDAAERLKAKERHAAKAHGGSSERDTATGNGRGRAVGETGGGRSGGGPGKNGGGPGKSGGGPGKSGGGRGRATTGSSGGGTGASQRSRSGSRDTGGSRSDAAVGLPSAPAGHALPGLPGAALERAKRGGSKREDPAAGNRAAPPTSRAGSDIAAPVSAAGETGAP